jgi:5-methylcytosine-specific restriction protein A
MFESREERQDFYNGNDWKNLRRYKLSISPLCEQCLIKGVFKAATEVHHKVDIADTPTRVLDITNLESLCKHCHSSHTFKKTRKSMSSIKVDHIKRLYKM